LDLALVLGVDVDTLHHNAVFVGKDIDHLAALALVFEAAADDLYRVTFTDLYSHFNYSCAAA
jgi:hypothetical protein